MKRLIACFISVAVTVCAPRLRAEDTSTCIPASERAQHSGSAFTRDVDGRVFALTL